MHHSVMVVEDQQMVREGFRALFARERDFRLLDDVPDGHAAMTALAQHRPDVLILDLVQPPPDGFDILRSVRDRSPRTRVVIVTQYDYEPYVHQALKTGASAYVLKEEGSDAMFRAVRDALQGRRYFSPRVNDRMVERYVERAERIPDDPLDTLSPREIEVLQLAAEGKTSPEIAERLFITARTVESHRANVMRKLGLRSQVDLLRYALRKGMIPP